MGVCPVAAASCRNPGTLVFERTRPRPIGGPRGATRVHIVTALERRFPVFAGDIDHSCAGRADARRPEYR